MSEIRKEKMLRDILVVKTDVVYKDTGSERPWFIPYDEANFEEIILKRFVYKQRGEMEEDRSYQQPIPYVIIHNEDTNKFIAYKRGGASSAAGEQRLFGQWSLWVWGHIEKEQEKDKNPIRSTVYKEIEEEIGLTDITGLQVLWYIVDATVPVNLYHLGVVYIATTKTTDVEVVDGELENVYFLSEQEVEDIIASPDADLESRSHIARDAYKEIYS